MEPRKIWLVDEYTGQKREIELGRNELIEFSLHTMSEKSKRTYLIVGYNTAYLGIEGYGDMLTDDDHGCVVGLDAFYIGEEHKEFITQDQLVVHVWGDINEEDPTHRVEMGRAKLENREDMDKEPV